MSVSTARPRVPAITPTRNRSGPAGFRDDPAFRALGGR